jgi:hypothetical protein
MGLGKYTHPKYYAKRATNWESNERAAQGGCLTLFLILFAVAAVVFAVVWVVSVIPHLVGLTPSAMQLFNHNAAWEHAHYPLIGLRYVGAVALDVALVGGVTWLAIQAREA